MNLRICYIYTLTNPINNLVFYIGSAYDVERRFFQHINDSTYYSGKNLTKYINKMNCRPVIEVVDEILVMNKREALKTEIYWIDQFRQWGFRLTNSQFNLSKISDIQKSMA